jgi:hypothetical protein
MLGASLGLPLCVTASLLWCYEVLGATLGASLGSVSEESASLSVGFILLLPSMLLTLLERSRLWTGLPLALLEGACILLWICVAFFV